MSNSLNHFEFTQRMLDLLPTTSDKAVSVQEITDTLIEQEIYLYAPKNQDADPKNRLRTPQRHLNKLVNAHYVKQVNTSSGYKYFKLTGNSNKPLPLFKVFSQRTLADQSFDSTEQNAKRVSSTLTEQELQQRIIHKCALVVMQPSTKLDKHNKVILDAIKAKRKVSFKYFKSRDQKFQSRTCEPIGIINDNGHFLLIAANENGCMRKYTIAKMEEVQLEYHKPFFHLGRHSHQKLVAILCSGIEEYWLTETDEKIKLIVKKEAANVFASSRLAYCKKWQFTWIDRNKSIAEVSFERKISVKLLRFIQSYGKYIEVKGSAMLKQKVAENYPLEQSTAHLNCAA